MLMLLGADVRDIVHPAKVLSDVSLKTGAKAEMVFGGQGHERLELFMDGRQIIFLQNDEVGVYPFDWTHFGLLLPTSGAQN